MSKKITNINGAAEDVCRCGSWLAHWEKLSGRKQLLCPEVNCDNRAMVGAMVQKEGDTDGRWYIIPLCWDHSTKSGQGIEVVDAARLVPAEAGENCGRGELRPGGTAAGGLGPETGNMISGKDVETWIT